VLEGHDPGPRRAGPLVQCPEPHAVHAISSALGSPVKLQWGSQLSG
jgi:hypothetical protein